MAHKITIKNDGVYVDDVPIPGVTSAEVKNINPGTTGNMEVVLHFPAREVDVQYKQREIPASVQNAMEKAIENLKVTGPGYMI